MRMEKCDECSDKYREGQREAYERIGGADRLVTLDPERCGCSDRRREQEQEQKVLQEALAEAALLTLFVVVLILDDALPGGQVDDAAIPGAVARILDRLTLLLRGLGPVVP